MPDKTEKVVTRFAPSPTGFMHIGGVRTALYAYLFAKKHGGDFILRIEDTDKEREVEGSIEHIQESLRWLGIEWTYGPDKPGPFGSCVQSERLDIYTEYAKKLIDKGLAYPDPYTTEEIIAFRGEAEENKQSFLYRTHRPETFDKWDGTRPLRFKASELIRYNWHDEVRGDLSAGEEMLDDFIIIKSDGYPTYNFAHLVDDLEMGVTHVMRGEEFIASMPKFLSLYDALEVPWPKFVTLPPIMGPDGKKKLSKRDGAKDLLKYRDDGYLPEAMNNFLALIGWNPGGEQEIFSAAELEEKFSLEKIQKSGGAFNEDKLNWMNREHLAKLSPEAQTAYVKAGIPSSITALPQYSEERLERFMPCILERIQTQLEVKNAAERGEYTWVFQEPDYRIDVLQWKNDPSPANALPRLQKVLTLLETADFGSSDSIKAAVWDYAEEEGKGEVLWPLRVALTGLERSPDPFICAWILGKEESLKRVESACVKIDS